MMATKQAKIKIGNSAYIVKKPFRDKDSFLKEYLPGEDVSHFEEKRLEHLVSIGYVAEPDAAEGEGEDASTGSNNG